MCSHLIYCPAMLKKLNVSIACSALVGYNCLVCHPLIINVQGNPGQYPNMTSLYRDDLDKNFNPAIAVCLGYLTDDVYLMNKVHAHT